MTDGDKGRDEDSALRARLDELAGALKARREAAASARGDGGPPESVGSAMSMGMRAGTEFIAAIVAGGLIGWGLDRWLGTKPGFLIAFFLVGSAAGVWNVIRVTSPKGAPVDRNSRLSGAQAPDKDVRRSAPRVGNEAPDGADDDED